MRKAWTVLNSEEVVNMIGRLKELSKFFMQIKDTPEV